VSNGHGGTPGINDGIPGVSRRSVLAGLGLGSLSALAAGRVLAPGPAAAATAGPKIPAAPAIPAARAAQAPPTVVSPAPGDFSIRASCDLTEDYFLTSEILLDAANGDRVIPFVNPLNGNAVEAIVFVQGVNGGPGTVSHLARSSAVPSGWTYTHIDLSGTVPSPKDVAVAADSSAVYIMVLAEPDTGPGPAWLSQLDSATTWNSGYVASYDDLGFKDLPISPPATFGPLKGGFDHVGGNAYFYASTTDGTETALIGWLTGNGWQTGNFNYQLLQVPATSPASVVDYIVLFDTTASTSPVGYSLVLYSGGLIEGYKQLPYTSQNSPQFTDASLIPNVTDEAVTELVWAWATPGSKTGLPGYAYQQTENIDYGISAGTVFFDESGHEQTLSDQATLGNNAVAIWLDNGLYTVNLLDPSDKLSTTAQYTGPSGPAWGVAVPIGVGLSAVFSVPTDPAESTLFAVDPGGVLNVLTKGATGWTQNVVHQDAASTIEVVSWRCQIGLYDANGANVGPSSGSVQLTTNLPIDIWQDNSSIVLLPGSTVTLPLGARGQTSVSIPTAELDTAVLTATPLDANGNPRGPALAIVPNTDTQNYLAGTGSLTSAGGTTLSGTSLTSAQDKVWDSTTQTYVPQGALMPTLAKAGASAADQVAKGITHVMSLPTNTASDGIQSTLLDLTGSTPSFQTSTNPAAFDSHKTGATSWWDKAVHDIDSVFRGLRHAAITVGKMISTWDAHAEQWTINLVVDLGDGVDQLMSWVITGIEDAYHAVSSFFHSLGTDIEGIWNWLKNLVLSALRDAGANAKVVETWAETLVDTLISGINSFESVTDDELTTWAGDVSTWLTTLQGQVDKELFGTNTQQPTPAPGTGGDDSGSHFDGAQDVFHFLAHSPASWLFSKITADIKPIEGSALAAIQVSNFAPAANDLASAVDAVVDTIIDAVTTIVDALGDAAKSPAGFNAQSMNDLFNNFKTLSGDIFTLLKSLANLALDLLKAFIESLNDLLTAEFQPPFIGEVLHLAGVDNTPSILHLTALIIAFPATLLHTLFSAALGGVGQPLFPFTSPTGEAAGNSESDWAGFGLGVAATVTQSVWSLVDVGLEMIAYDSGQPSPADLLFVDIFTAIDILCPFLLMIFQWPVPPTYTGTQTPAPFHYADFRDGSVWGNWYVLLPGIFVTGGVPFLTEAIGFILSKIPAIPKDEADSYNNKVVPIHQTLSSATNLILSAWYSYSNATNDGAKAEAVIGPVISSISYLDSMIASDQAKSIDLTPWIKFYLDIFGNAATMWIDIGEAIAAAAK
jgi:hypothetical protein